MLFLSFLSPVVNRFISSNRSSLRWWSPSLSFERKHQSSKQWPKRPRSGSPLEVVSIYIASFRCKMHCPCRITRTTTYLSSALDVSPANPFCWPESCLDYNRRTLIDHFEQFDHVLVTHPHAPVTRSCADFVLVFGAMNVHEAVARIRVVLVQSV